MPKGAKYIIDALCDAGFDAYAVGGCVRDCLMGRVPTDWDITTQASPKDIKDIFVGCKMIDIGERHGTIAVNAFGKYFEVTTYRIDGSYGDGRRPDSVSFTNVLQEDLRRRDFTINAMAYNDTAGLVDYFGGVSDIKQSVIRCVGDAALRFSEDYLRIMRAYRFAAVLGFDLTNDVRLAAVQMRDNLHNIAVERVQAELVKMITTDNFDCINMFFNDCGPAIFPEISRLSGVAQNNSYHCYDVYDHTFAVFAHTAQDAAMRLAALYHDAGKYFTKTTDTNGIDHFYGHAKVSFEIAEGAFKKWRFDNATINRALNIIKYHDINAGTDRMAVKRTLNRLGESLLRDILDFQVADNMAKTQLAKDVKLKEVFAAKGMLDEIAASGEPVHISKLAVGGKDVMEVLGIASSAAVGEHLGRLMDRVIEEPELNNYDSLVKILKNTESL